MRPCVTALGREWLVTWRTDGAVLDFRGETTFVSSAAGRVYARDLERRSRAVRH